MQHHAVRAELEPHPAIPAELPRGLRAVVPARETGEQQAAGPHLISAQGHGLRSRLDIGFGEPKRSFGEGCGPLAHRFASEDTEPLPLRLKIEINSREHLSVLGIESRPLDMRSRWLAGAASISTCTLDELLGTKLRAFCQRSKGRDRFDLRWAVTPAAIDFNRGVACFREPMRADALCVSRPELEANLAGKLQDRVFTADLEPLQAPGIEWDLNRAPRLPGETREGPRE